jgi:FkbM family methyltransferase
MGILDGVRSHYPLFGPYSLWLLAKGRLLRKLPEINVSVTGIRHPLYLRLRTSDVSLFHEIIVAGEYEWDFAKSPSVIVDAGANIGLASVFYANKYPEARIVAIEAELSNYHMLKKNVAPYPNIIPIHAAVWKENKNIYIHDPGTQHWGFQTTEKGMPASDASDRQVRGITLDAVMAQNELSYVDVLKMDIEGAEREVFESPGPWINKVGVLVIELHDHLKAGCSRSVYSTTKSFEYQWQRGETVFLVRKEYAGEDAMQTPALVASSVVTYCRGGINLPCKILSAR